MGLHSVIWHATSKMKKGDTTNSRTLGKWAGRVTGIAQDLEKSRDIAKLSSERQRRLKTVVADVAERLASIETIQPAGSTSQFSPSIYQKRKDILSEADTTLDTFQVWTTGVLLPAALAMKDNNILFHFLARVWIPGVQPPPKGHPEAMRKAMSSDERALGAVLKGLSQAGDGLLKEVSEIAPITGTKRRTRSQASSERQSSQVLILLNEERAYEQFEKKLAQYKQGDRAPSITIVISGMDSENGEISTQSIPLDHTFCALVDSLTDFNNESFLPDFWSKETDRTRNCVTESGVWWEWQDPSKKVIDAVNKKGHLGIETVCKAVEYVVVLVKEGMMENGVPIEIPRTCRQRAFLHIQQHFPNHVVSQVRQLQLGDDVRDVVFDSRSFRHQTNPLFVELELSVDPTEPNGAMEVESVPRIDKGKGRAIGRSTRRM